MGWHKVCGQLNELVYEMKIIDISGSTANTLNTNWQCVLSSKIVIVKLFFWDFRSVSVTKYH